MPPPKAPASRGTTLTTFLLVRHGAYDGLDGSLSGRIPGVALNANGRAQIRRLGERLRDRIIAGLYSSPLQRARDTATILARALSLPVQTEPDLREVDFGAWTDRGFDALEREMPWRAFHEQRTTSAIPGGELMLEVQARAIRCLARLGGPHTGHTIVCVTHADVIRSILAGCLGFSLDTMVRLAIEPASLSEVCLGECPPRVIRVNDAAHLVSGSASASAIG